MTRREDIEFCHIRVGDKITAVEQWADTKGGIYTETFTVSKIKNDCLWAKERGDNPWVDGGDCTYTKHKGQSARKADARRLCVTIINQ